MRQRICDAAIGLLPALRIYDITETSILSCEALAGSFVCSCGDLRHLNPAQQGHPWWQVRKPSTEQKNMCQAKDLLKTLSYRMHGNQLLHLRHSTDAVGAQQSLQDRTRKPLQECCSQASQELQGLPTTTWSGTCRSAALWRCIRPRLLGNG